MPAATSIKWTNRSVLEFAKDSDPFEAVEEAARNLVLKARQEGWHGPPFNPLRLAEMLDAKTVANSDVADARLVSAEGGPVIHFNPKQPRERVRFSIAHEIAHLMFPDWSVQTGFALVPRTLSKRPIMAWEERHAKTKRILDGV